MKPEKFPSGVDPETSDSELDSVPKLDETVDMKVLSETSREQARGHPRPVNPRPFGFQGSPLTRKPETFWSSGVDFECPDDP